MTAIIRKGESSVVLPSVCFTVTSFQKRFCSALAGFLGSERMRRAASSKAACFLLRAIRSSRSEGGIVGAGGGGAGAAGWGIGVAAFVDVEWMSRDVVANTR